MSFVPRGHPQQVAHRDGALARLPGFELPDVIYDIDDRGTDPAEFAVLHQRFRFSIDVAASDHNTKLDRYFTVDDDGLAQSWSGERVWCNPPYSNIEPWVLKAWGSWDAHFAPRPEIIVMLLPANRTEQGWWQRHVEPRRDRGHGLTVTFLPNRMRFIAPGADRIGPNERPPFGCVLLVWGMDRDQ